MVSVQAWPWGSQLLREPQPRGLTGLRFPLSPRIDHQVAGTKENTCDPWFGCAPWKGVWMLVASSPARGYRGLSLGRVPLPYHIPGGLSWMLQGL